MINTRPYPLPEHSFDLEILSFCGPAELYKYHILLQWSGCFIRYCSSIKTLDYLGGSLGNWHIQVLDNNCMMKCAPEALCVFLYCTPGGAKTKEKNCLPLCNWTLLTIMAIYHFTTKQVTSSLFIKPGIVWNLARVYISNFHVLQSNYKGMQHIISFQI